MRIFLSYRRGDVGGYAGRLADSLKERLGAKGVFQDVTAIGPGQDYTAVIDRALDESDAVLALIGPNWLAAATPHGTSRLFEPDDYVRLELTRALQRDVRVVPVLVGAASVPAVADLPEDLRGLAQRQAVAIHDETWHQDVDGLVSSLRGETSGPIPRLRRWLVPAALVVAVAAVAAFVWSRGSGAEPRVAGTATTSDQPTSSPTAPLACPPAEGAGWQPIPLGSSPSTTVPRSDGSFVYSVKYARWRAQDGKWQVVLGTELENDTPGQYYHVYWLYRAIVVGQREFGVGCFSSDRENLLSETVGYARIGFEVTCKPVGYMELRLEASTIRLTDTPEPGPC